MSYQQLLAGGLTFQLYNKQTNTIIPSSISDGDGYLEIVEDATDSHDTIYKIDQFAGAKTEITLYTEGQSAATYALMAVSQNEGVHSVRSFNIAREINGDTWRLVSLEIDGKMYIPTVLAEGDHCMVNMNDASFEPAFDFPVDGYDTVFPFIDVQLKNDEQLGDGYAMVIPSLGNIETASDDSIWLAYKETYENDEPWKYGQDGIFATIYGAFIRINGVNHLITKLGGSVDINNTNISVTEANQTIYTNGNHSLRADVETNVDIAIAKERMSAELGLTFGSDIEIGESVDADCIQPFAIIS